MKKFLKNLFARYETCFWCDMPLPDCCCPMARHPLSARKVANDNSKVFRLSSVSSGLAISSEDYTSHRQYLKDAGRF